MYAAETEYFASEIATVLETKKVQASKLPTMDACETLDNDGCSSEVSWFQGGMLPAASLTIVGIPNDHPGYTIGL